MKWLPALIFAAGIAFAESQPQKLPIAAFDGGLNSNYSGLGIADNEVQDSLNVYFDGNTPVEKREGYALCGSTDSVSMDSSWSYSDSGNNGWLIIRKPTKIIASNQGCTFTVTIATVSASDTINAVNAFGYIYFVDRTQGVYSWNGTSTTYVANSPRGSLIAEFRGRVWVSGLAHPYGNQLYSSGYLDGSNWTLGSLTTSPVLLTFGLNDSYDNITSIFSGYNDSMQIFKNLSIYALYGFDQSDFEARILNREVGCIDNRSVQPFLGGLVFASRRGVEFFDGVTVQTPPISDKVGNLLNNNAVTSSSELSWTQTSQADFESGGINPSGSLSTTILSGSVIVSSFSVTESASSQWSSGTSSNVVVNGDSIEILRTTNYGNYANSNFETGASGAVPSSWVSTTVGSGSVYVKQTSTGSSGLSCSGSYSGYTNTHFAEPASGVKASENARLIVALLDPSTGAELQSSTYSITSTNCAFSTKTFSVSSGLVGSYARLKFFQIDDSNRVVYMQTSSTGIIKSNLSFLLAVASNGSGFNFASIDDVRTLSTGTFTSQIYNFGSQSALYSAPSFTYSVNVSTPSFVIQTSTSPTGVFSTAVNNSTSTSAFGSQYFRYVVTFSPIQGDIGTSLFNSISILARSSGTYRSAVYNAPNLTSFASLAVTMQDNGGSHTFYMRSSTSTFTVNSSTPAWTAQPANTTISIASGTYFQVRDDFSMTAATHTPTLNDFSVSWREGTPRQPMASVVADKRYILSFSTTTTVNKNTGTLVLTKGPVWSFWDIPAGSLLSHRGAYYFTNNSDNGKVYTLFSGTSDDTAAINSYVKTKDFALGDITQDKLMDSFYLIFDSKGATNITTKYFLDRQSTEYSLASVLQDETDGLVTAKLNFPLAASTPNYGKTISFKIGSNDTVDSLALYGGILNYRTRMTQ